MRRKTPYFIRLTARRILSRWPKLYFAVRSAYRGAEQGPAESEVQQIIKQRFAKGVPVRFVQIGSNDGKQGDPLHDYIKQRQEWSGLFVEPIEFLFERLQTNYGHDSRFQYANVAISEKEEVRPFYFVSEDAKKELGDALPWWHDQLASFDRQHIIKHLDGMLEPYIVCRELSCISLPTLLEQHSIEEVDLLHIDTEGFDYQVLKQFDLNRHNASVILYETKHLSAEEKAAAREMLIKGDYTVKDIGADAIALKNG